MTSEDMIALFDTLARLENLLSIIACVAVALIGAIVGVACAGLLGKVVYDLLSKRD